MSRMSIRLFLLVVSTTCAAAQDPAVEWPCPPGWEWAVRPLRIAQDFSSAIDCSTATADLAVAISQYPPGPLAVDLVSSPQSRHDVATFVEYRPVGFTHDRTPIVARHRSSCTSRGFHLDRFTFEQSADNQPIEHVGIQQLTPAGRREFATDARHRARDAEIAVLPLPLRDEPFSFALQSLDGETVTSESLRGKVVLIDCWATWCGPCMKKMPELRKLHQHWKDQGVQILGVCFDDDVSRARQAIEEQQLDWPHVLVPADETGRRLWKDASGISTLPRLFLIDREGILRDDFYPHDLSGHVAQFMARLDSIADPTRFRVADLDWLSGRWAGELFGMTAEEHWTAPAGDSMIGMFRLGAESAKPMYEMLLIQQEIDGVTLRLHHFRRNLKRDEEEPLVFRLVKRGHNKAVFEDPDQPHVYRLSYSKTGPDRLTVRLDMKGETADQSVESTWTRIP